MNRGQGRLVGRRFVLRQTGRAVVGFAILGLAACESGGGGTAGDASAEPSDADSGGSGGSAGLAWSRVDLGFVAAYVLVRGREAAVVDTGVAGSAEAIGGVLDEAGPGWAGVRHVLLTHKHPDHAGSLGDVLESVTGAQGYVGAADLAAVDSPRQLATVGDDDEVFGLQVVATPGHTAGHVAVFDAATGVLVAGDALTNNGGLAGSSPQFTEDEAAAAASVRKLALLAPRTILVGHGEPLLDGAADALEQLAASLA